MERERQWRRMGSFLEQRVLEPTSYDQLSFGDFARCFAREYRDTQEIRKLYDDFRLQRAELRDEARRHINSGMAALRAAALPVSEALVEGFSLAEAIELLEGLSADLTRRIEALDREIAQRTERVTRFVACVHTLHVRADVPASLGSFPEIDGLRRMLQDEVERLGSAGAEAQVDAPA